MKVAEETAQTKSTPESMHSNQVPDVSYLLRDGRSGDSATSASDI